jgi:hypothetical protein
MAIGSPRARAASLNEATSVIQLFLSKSAARNQHVSSGSIGCIEDQRKVTHVTPGSSTTLTRASVKLGNTFAGHLNSTRLRLLHQYSIATPSYYDTIKCGHAPPQSGWTLRKGVPNYRRHYSRRLPRRAPCDASTTKSGLPRRVFLGKPLARR